MNEVPWRIGKRLLPAFLLLSTLLPTAGCSEVASLREPGELRNRALALYTPLIAPNLETADLAPIAHASAPPFGVNTFLEQEVDEEKLRRTLQMARDAGFTWIRQEFPWRDIEQSRKGDFWDYKWNKSAWDKYDRIVALANESGLNIIAGWMRPRTGRARTTGSSTVPPMTITTLGTLWPRWHRATGAK